MIDRLHLCARLDEFNPVFLLTALHSGQTKPLEVLGVFSDQTTQSSYRLTRYTLLF